MAISEYDSPLQNSLEQYVPLPLEMMMKAGAATQQRYDQSLAEDSALQTGIASTETRAPGYKDYVTKTLGSYKQDMSSLIDKYDGRLDDPQFRRESKEIQNRYLNDPAWQQIKVGNENIKKTQDLQDKLKADGRLFISDLPNFTGRDKDGNPIAFTGGIEGVNTLDDWEKATKMAWQSEQNNGHGLISNEKNLKANAQAMLNNVATGGIESQKLIKAYEQQGFSPEQAHAQVMKNISTLASNYGVVKKADEGYLSRLQSASQFKTEFGEKVREFNENKAMQEARMKNAFDIAKLKAAGKGKTDETVLTPYSTPVLQTNQATKDGLKAVVSDVSNIKLDKEIKDPTNFSGSFFMLDPTKNSDKESSFKREGGFNINAGKVIGYKNVLVNDKGNLVLTGNNRPIDSKPDPVTGEMKNYVGNVPVHKLTVQEIQSNIDPDDSTGKKRLSDPITYYRPANRDEAINFMGASGANYEGKYKNDPFYNLGSKTLVQRKNGNIIGSKGNLNIDDNRISTVIQDTYRNLPEGDEKNQVMNEAYKEIKGLVDKYNNKGISTKEYELLRKSLGNDRLDDIYHRQLIDPQYRNQGKLKRDDPDDDIDQ